MMFQSEENIIQDFIDGKEYAFKEIYERNVSTLRYFGNKYLPDERLIEDILQDTFVSLWENRKRFCNELTIKSFLYTSVKNRCLNPLRHEKIKQRYAEEFVEEPQESFLEKVIETELFEMLHYIFEELPPACKEVYQLSLEGKKHEEIASLLNISINTVKKYKNNANHYMRKRVKDFRLFLLLLKAWDSSNNV